MGDFTKLKNNNSADPHEAIRVTHIEQSSIPDGDAKLKGLYKLIWKTTVESCMKDAKYKVIDAVISSPMSDAKYVYTIEIPLFLGWKTLNREDNEKDLESSQSIGNGMLLYLESILSGKNEIICHKIHSEISIQNRTEIPYRLSPSC